MVSAGFNGLASYDVYIPSEYLLEFILHTHQVEQAMLGFGKERHENIHIAVWPKIFSQNGAEQGNFRNIP